ncbi:MAG: Gfo/Idh/MocA family oxidoreductase [Chloroflexi bacterium]|nr:Gfo/Idh/MocA family oxidoreductase [Chloroflexota bacterium]
MATAPPPLPIGLISFAHVHAPGYAGLLATMPEIAFTGIYDRDGKRGLHEAQRRGVPFYATLPDLWDHCQAVVIMAENVLHAEYALAAANAGKHILCEKPLAHLVADGEAMVADCQTAGVVLATAFPCPFSPAFEALVQQVQAGQLGTLLALHTTNRGYLPGGWFVDLSLSGGGAVMDHTVHVADLLRRLLNGPPATVNAEIGNSIYREQWDDSGLLTMCWAGGAFATLDCSWSRTPSFPTWGDVTIKAIGTAGVAEVHMFNQHITYYPASQGKGAWQGWGPNLDRLVLLDFIQAIRDHRPPRSTGADGLAALKIALAAYTSNREHAPVTIT